MITLAKPGPKLWCCDVCNQTERWNDSWRWYGSTTSEEGCGHRLVICSEKCRDTKRALELVAAYESKHRSGSCTRGRR